MKNKAVIWMSMMILLSAFVIAWDCPEQTTIPIFPNGNLGDTYCSFPGAGNIWTCTSSGWESTTCSDISPELYVCDTDGIDHCVECILQSHCNIGGPDECCLDNICYALHEEGCDDGDPCTDHDKCYTSGNVCVGTFNANLPGCDTTTTTVSSTTTTESEIPEFYNYFNVTLFILLILVVFLFVMKIKRK